MLLRNFHATVLDSRQCARFTLVKSVAVPWFVETVQIQQQGRDSDLCKDY